MTKTGSSVGVVFESDLLTLERIPRVPGLIVLLRQYVICSIFDECISWTIFLLSNLSPKYFFLEISFKTVKRARFLPWSKYAPNFPSSGKSKTGVANV